MTKRPFSSCYSVYKSLLLFTGSVESRPGTLPVDLEWRTRPSDPRTVDTGMFWGGDGNGSGRPSHKTKTLVRTAHEEPVWLTPSIVSMKSYGPRVQLSYPVPPTHVSL